MERKKNRPTLAERHQQATQAKEKEFYEEIEQQVIQLWDTTDFKELRDAINQYHKAEYGFYKRAIIATVVVYAACTEMMVIIAKLPPENYGLFVIPTIQMFVAACYLLWIIFTIYPRQNLEANAVVSDWINQGLPHPKIEDSGKSRKFIKKITKIIDKVDQLPAENRVAKLASAQYVSGISDDGELIFDSDEEQSGPSLLNSR